MNKGRFALAVLIATVIFFVTDGFMHEALLKSDWMAVYEGIKATPSSEHNPMNMLWFVLFELGRAFATLFLYVQMRTRFGAGPKTAVLAGVIGWLGFSVAGPAQFIPLGFVTCALWMKWAAFHLVTSIVGTIAGAAAYKE